MLEKSKKRVKRGTTFTVNLHEDVLENIISFFPIKDATRCGQLSTRFKNAWRFCRNLVFDLDFARGLTKGNQIKVINRVFNQHLGPKIDIFHLYFDPTGVEALVKYWLKRVTLKGVEELDLDFTRGDVPFKLPSHLFEVESIRSLKLAHCRLNLSTQLQGLSFLKTLVLRRVNIKSIQIATIFANCFLLEGIELLRCFGTLHLEIFARRLKKYKQLVVRDCDITSIAIDAPTLSTLSFCGKVCHFGFYSPMLNLDEVVLIFTPTRSGFPRFCLVTSLMISISNVNILKVSSTFLELGEFPFENGLYWKMHGKPKLEKCNPTFQRLKKIMVKGFKFEMVELEMLKFFLNQAKFLESIALVPSRNCRSKGFSQDKYQIVFRLWKASPNAKIRCFAKHNLVLPHQRCNRCGQLSTGFKNAWRFCRNLVFDLDFARGLTKENQIRVINHVFYQHLGPKIDIFHLYFDPTDVEALVECWLKMVTLKGVEELDLDFTRGGVLFKLPSHLFEVKSIRSLKLTCCRFDLPDLPTQLHGLYFLKTLVLKRVNINTIQMEKIFAYCFLLEGIELLSCIGTVYLDIIGRHLKKYKQLVVGDCDIISISIDNPTVSTLSFCGEYCHFGFYSPMLNLDEAVLNITPTRSSFPRLCLVNNLVIGISTVNTFKVSSAFLKLGEVHLENGLYWEMHGKLELEKCNPSFPRLKKIMVNGFKFRTFELQMLKFFLKQAKFLESVALVPSGCYSKEFYQITDQLFCLWKASPNTTIRIFKSIWKIKNWNF
ncbi:hypothetical protein Acr_08g0001940 [Actinidia rufa]|uniref:F-box/RNI-like superfamily protein n=1 Tax=Actinidia rufa TaxID=165716 RepID=A0A7J0EZD1_9ERIC|nr:hypothetical protein Acr_08g0001940 [Actinidia rufa]